MFTHSRFTPILAMAGVLALGTASIASAQDTSAATRRADTSAYRQYPSTTDTSRTDTTRAAQPSARTDTGFKYTGPATDTTLKAKPGAQTGPTAGDSGRAARRAGAAGMPDTVVCKDGSNTAYARRACRAHGGIDWAATRAAMKARGVQAPQPADSTAGQADTSQVNKQGAGYQYHGARSDTALKAKPGTQTGADTGAGTDKDSSSTRQ